MQVDSAAPIVIVSGLPRSGTSMMMQMLEAGGLSILADQVRSANEDNPHGFYECRQVRRLHKDASFLDAAAGRVVKVVSPLVRALPAAHDYRIVFMDRAIDEVLLSQERMLDRAAASGAASSPAQPPSPAEMRAAFSQIVDRVEAFVSASSNIHSIKLSHREAIKDPMRVAIAVSRFLVDLGLDPEDEAQLRRMASIVTRELYRSRGSASLRAWAPNGRRLRP